MLRSAFRTEASKNGSSFWSKMKAVTPTDSTSECGILVVERAIAPRVWRQCR
jgi:hypothetical protein